MIMALEIIQKKLDYECRLNHPCDMDCEHKDRT